MLTEQDIKKVKGQGFLLNRGTEKFSARVVTGNGTLSADEMRTLCDAAEKFGAGRVCMTTRLGIEIPGIPFESIPAFQEYIGKAGLYAGGTGAKVRPIVACKGTTCTFGLYDTQGLAAELHERFYLGWHDVTLPAKFKIACGGCPNNCVKPDLNDLGIIGQRPPVYDEAVCRACGKCAAAEKCPMKAVAKQPGEKPVRDEAVCNNCGRCASFCPFGAYREGEVLYKLVLGGRWGRRGLVGVPMKKLFTRDELFGAVERALIFYRDNGVTGERFSATIERVGRETAEAFIEGRAE